MSDFFQNGEIATFHRLKHRGVLELEAELEAASKHRPISLVLPFIPTELHGAGLPRIVEMLHAVKLRRITNASHHNFNKANFPLSFNRLSL